MNSPCSEHSGVCERMKAAEQNIEKLFKGIDAMKAWVIGGMTSMIISGMFFIGNMLVGKHP